MNWRASKGDRNDGIAAVSERVESALEAGL